MIRIYYWINRLDVVFICNEHEQFRGGLVGLVSYFIRKEYFEYFAFWASVPERQIVHSVLKR